MSGENIIFEKDNEIGLLTINRPKSLNALNPSTLKEMLDLLLELTVSSDIKVLIITGAGDKAFVAGADIKEMVDFCPLEAGEFSNMGHLVFSTLEGLTIPTIAAVNGFALGGGCELALACDFIYASEKAKFGQPEINLGIIPGFGGTQRLARRVGIARAKEMIFTGQTLSAEEAVQIGLVNKVCSPDDLLPEVRKVAATLQSKSSLALRAAKEVIQHGLDVDLTNGCRFEKAAFSLLFSSQDQEEGMKAFLEKRKPKFSGK